MLPSEYSCPKCKCRACYPLHRKGLDWPLSLVGLRPARCLTCGRRFFARYRLAADGSVVVRGHADNASSGEASYPGPGFASGSKSESDEKISSLHHAA